MAVPSATPHDIVVQLNALINEALTAPEVRRRMDEFGLSCDITDLAACEAEVRAERERWTEYTTESWPAFSRSDLRTPSYPRERQ